MKYQKLIKILLLSVFILSDLPAFNTLAGSPGGDEDIVILGKFSEDSLNEIIAEASGINDPGERIDFLSGKFLDVPYKDYTLTGSNDTEEILTINLEGLDCFTYLDYVEAMRLSGNYTEFRQNLVRTRYKNSVVDYKMRNHFFTDWLVYNKDEVLDATGKAGGDKVSTEIKELNRIDGNRKYLEGIDIVRRAVKYIPSGDIDEDVLKNIRNGDYLGIYSDKTGLDVSHTGIAIKKFGKTYIRHASSREENRKVVEELLTDYIKKRPGLVIIRPAAKD